MNIAGKCVQALLLFLIMSETGGRNLFAQSNKQRGFSELVRELSATATSVSVNAVHGTTSKCGLGIRLEILDHWKEFTTDEQRQLERLLAGPVTQKSRIAGHFQIFYDTTGVHVPSLLDFNSLPIPNSVEQYVDSVAKYVNYAWSFEVDSLGYDAPPLIVGENYYDIYIQELGSNSYGFTQPVNQINAQYPPLYDSFIEIDNDYKGFFSPGIAGLKVTTAHEFHHSIQIGRYGFWSSDRYFLEITSTWMEDVVHNDVNDYYQYLSNSSSQVTQFSYPSIRFTEDDQSIEYSRAIWGKFIEQRFSRATMRSTWSYIRQVQAITAIDRALNDAGSSFRDAFLEWGVWNMNTGIDADTTAYFYTEGRSYPPMRMKPMVSYSSGQRTMSGSIGVMSSEYYPFSIYNGNGDTSRMNTIISNVNVAETNLGQAYSYIIADQGDDSFRHLSNGLFTKLSVGDPVNWSSREILIDSGNHIHSVPAVVSTVVAFPNPFRASGSAKLHFRLPASASTDANLLIISSTLDRIYSQQMPIVELMPAEPSLLWDGIDESGRTIATGIYFYFITVGDLQFTGKFAVIRD